MTLRDFLNAHNKLNFIDRQDWMTDDQWAAFSKDPVRFLRKAHTDVADRLWALTGENENA